jgi:hypothetical protein
MRNIDEQFSGLRFCVGRGEKTGPSPWRYARFVSSSPQKGSG